jgi:hypothetical protein
MWMPIPVPSSPRVGQGGQSGGGGAVEGGQGVDAGGGQIMHRAGLGIGDPQREPARGQDGLDAAAVAVGLAGVPQVDDLAFHADSGFFAPVGRDDVAGTCPQAPCGRPPGLMATSTARIVGIGLEIFGYERLACPEQLMKSRQIIRMVNRAGVSGALMS